MPSGQNTQYWVHDLSPFLWEFAPGIGIRYYGLAYVLGFVIGLWLLGRYSRAGRSPLSREQNGDLLFALVVGVLLGGRLGFFLLYAPAELLASPLAFFRVWDGGMASHGGFAGVLVAGLWFARRTGVSFWTIADLIATITPPGLLLGRLANFINGELWGKITRVPWAVIFPKSDSDGTPVHLLFPRHPSQLYEAALEGLLLLVYLQLRFWRSGVVGRHPGQLTGEFLVGYALSRMFCELFREPDRGIDPILGLSRGTFYSIFLFAAGLGILLWARFGQPNRGERVGSHNKPLRRS
ncbi:MAG TPA: prolipoprotein diacylglyceryl transferase [Opitutaceae bacterium]|nr:prolipoprotein diacylglyceryl transferase [Opitutaceae bacterium]